MTRLVFTELFKVRKRWMPWILLAVMIVLLALFQFSMYAAYQSMTDRPEDMQSILTLPLSTEVIFSMAQAIGSILLVILTASVVGTEYAWGTVRTNIIRGMGRNRYLLSKLTAILTLTITALLVTFIFGFVFTIVTTALTDGGVEWGFLGGRYIPRVLAMFGRTWFVLAVPISMVFMVAVLTRSSSVAIGVGIGYPIIETIIVNILAGVAGWGEIVQEYSIGNNTTAVMTYNAMTERYTNVGVNLSASTEAIPSFWRAGGLLAAYGLAFLVVAFYSFRKRDLTA